MPRVSVVIPAYNAMVYLPKTVDSVLKQTFTDFEVLIINDGSSDHILEWATGLQDPRVKVISQENQGLPGARNTGIIHAQGEYIAFLDADDLWAPTKLEKQVHCLDNKLTVGLVYTWTVLIDGQDNPTGRIFASHPEGNVWQQLMETNEMCNGSSSMVRRCCFDTVGLFDRSLKSAEDLDMWLRLSARYPFAVVKEPLTFYRQHSNSMSKNRERMIGSLRIVIEKTFQSVPLDLLHLRNRAYASLNVGLAWIAIDEGDYQKSMYFCQQAMLHHPQIRYSQKFIRLSLAILLIRCFGPYGYDAIRSLTRFLRWQILNFAR
ncbi:glycosyltransferase family 2 protein [Anabaena sp. UHCC 0399]|uniref:glycosyltransferase family 2 protein n=1 Tax=Anabaena sp. UHCC 0399 TaxID=3110238 RepID=UPI002B21FDA1|nr:glycosyltransferase [Anabaena sp. UHCC 0399]MEA5567048.1 glycosyltransferase [Anabaena sp. UHCC 0399]